MTEGAGAYSPSLLFVLCYLTYSLIRTETKQVQNSNRTEVIYTLPIPYEYPMKEGERYEKNLL